MKDKNPKTAVTWSPVSAKIRGAGGAKNRHSYNTNIAVKRSLRLPSLSYWREEIM